VRDRIIAETGGNPLALPQLPRGLGSAEPGDGFWLPDPHGVPFLTGRHLTPAACGHIRRLIRLR
jgi:hypothetical protein